LKNYYKDVVKNFGKEWTKFDYLGVKNEQLEKIYKSYFKIFPWDLINPTSSIGIDIGCGTGRWAKFTADKVKELLVLDASEQALNIARKNLQENNNVKFFNQSVGKIELRDNSLDFAYSLGVLHHIPDIKSALIEINRILKPKAPLLLYLYYNFDNKPIYYRLIWLLTEPFRLVISLLPFKIKFFITQLIALLVYFPLARVCRILKFFKIPIGNFPMNQYSDKSFYIMRTDALDRFGTKVEKRFSKKEIYNLLKESNFEDIQFSEDPPYWCCVAKKIK